MDKEFGKQTLNIPELAKALGISRGLAYELAKRNELPVPVVRLGRKRIVVSTRSLVELLSRELTSSDEKRTPTKE